MALTKEEVKSLWGLNPKTLAHEFGRILRDFGYSSVTDDWIEVEIGRLYGGGEAKGGPSMFIARWLEDGVE